MRWISIIVAAGCIGLAVTGCAPNEPAQPAGDVLLVVLDTTRADHLSSYGYSRKTTPELDRLAAEGQRFEEAWAQSSWTLPTVATILTGAPPHAHGAGRSPEGMFGIRDGVTTLAERMLAAGYRTAAVVSVVWCSPEISSLDRGFESYDFVTSDATNVGQRDAEAATDAALEWIAGLGDSDRSFLVVHYFDPHLSYDPPPPFDTMFEPDERPGVPPGFGSAAQVFQIRRGEIGRDPRYRESMVARYDGELRYTDDQFGRLRAALEAAGRWDDTLVVVVGDHGEEFWDHGGFEHGHSHYREMLRVPLIVRRPTGVPGEIRGDRVRQLDIVPTVLDFAGIAPDPGLPGRPLGRGGAEYAVAEGTLWGGDLVSVRSERGTLILDRASGASLRFAASDRAEATPIQGGAPGLREILDALPPPRTRDDRPHELTEEQIEQLRSLGYIK